MTGTVRHLEVRPGTYRDSVRLMEISQAVQGCTGVSDALVGMATGLNLELAGGMGFAPPGDAGPDDLLVAVVARDPATLTAALARLESELRETATPPASAGGTPPRTVGSAVRRSGAGVVLVSTPGRYAFLDAMDALDAGASVLLFSDNVPVEAEIVLKDTAARRGLLVMGPDCGTAVLAGTGLGFANVVRPGPVGLVAASGTGAQQIMCLLDAAGVGISHCLGVGGRDLSGAVAGRSALAALAMLDEDPATELIVLVSKPPDPGVAERVRAYAATLGTPVEYALVGPGRPDLTAATEAVLRRLGRPVPPWPVWRPAAPGAARRGTVRGLFAGGTLRDEAALIAGTGHPMVDLGADELTRGRPHPMIDPTVRRQRIAAEAADPECAVILLDVVLGYAADPDPAGGLAAPIAAAPVPVVVSLIGTPADPQDRDRQADVLCRAGATVFGSNAEATRYALRLVDAS